MNHPQLLFLILSAPLIALGVINLFYTERYFYWSESRTYANPLEPSAIKLKNMRLGGVIQLLGACCLAYLGLFGR